MWECAEHSREVHSNDELFKFVVCFKCEGYGHNPSFCPFSSTSYAGYERGSSTSMCYHEPRNILHFYDNNLGWNSQGSSSWEPSTSSSQWASFQPHPPSSPENFSLSGMKETLLAIYQESHTLPMTQGQRDDFESDIEELSSIIKLARTQGRELGAEEK